MAERPPLDKGTKSVASSCRFAAKIYQRFRFLITIELYKSRLFAYLFTANPTRLELEDLDFQWRLSLLGLTGFFIIKILTRGRERDVPFDRSTRSKNSQCAFAGEVIFKMEQM